MKKHLLISIIILLFTSAATAQSWQWGVRGGGVINTGNQQETIVDMATDSHSNVYIAAHVYGNTSVTIGSQQVTTYGNQDIVIASYNCDGNLRWTKTIGGSTKEEVTAIAVDNEGGIYITGQMGNGTKNFSTDTVQPGSSGGGVHKFFLIKYDSSGSYQWLRQPMPDTVDVTRRSYYNPLDMVTSPTGGIYMLCHLGTGPVSGSSFTITTQGVYMLHYNAQGSLMQVIPMDMQVSVDAPNITRFLNIRMARMNSGKFIIAGTVSALPPSFNYNFGIGGQVATHSMFVACFDTNGNLVWKKEGINDAYSVGFYYRPVINNSSGNIILGGKGYPAVSFSGYTFNNSYGGNEMPFICTLDTLGNTLWITNAATNAATMGKGATVSSNGTPYLTGDYPGILQWGSHSLKNIDNQGYDIFLAKFDAATGTVLGIDSLDGNFGNNDASNAIIADNKNNIYLGGSMGSQLYLNNDTLTSSGGSNDFFIAKYGSADCNTAVPVSITNFHATLQNKAVLCQWQTANEVNTSHFNIQRSTNGTEFNTIGKTNAAGTGNNTYSYTDNNIAELINPLSGGRGATIYYRLQNIDKDGSYTYSKIVQITSNLQLPTFNIYPNPAKNRIMVNGKGTVELYGITGNQLNHWQLNGNRIIDISNYNNGIYLMVLKENGQIKASSKLVIAK